MELRLSVTEIPFKHKEVRSWVKTNVGGRSQMQKLILSQSWQEEQNLRVETSNLIINMLRFHKEVPGFDSQL